MTGRAKDRIAQSKRVRSSSLAIVDNPQVARTCILQALSGLQMPCCLSLVLRMFCFVLLSFISFIEAAALRSIVLQCACAPTAARSYLTTICVLFCFRLFSLFLWRCRFFRVFLYHYRFVLVWSVCECVVIPFTLDVRLVDTPAGVRQEENHTGFLHLPFAVLALIFIARRIQPSLSLVDREVELCVPTN